MNLFESMLVRRWWLELPSVPLSEILASEYSTHKLLKLYRSIVKRKHGSRLLGIKFHLCLHFLENQLDFGVTSNVDTGPMESNHKCNSKKPSGQTQRFADTFELQTSCCYIENLILDKAVSTLEETYPLSIIKKLEPPLVGAKFSIQLTNDRDDNLLPNTIIIWDKSHCIETSYHPRFLGWLCSNILAVVGQDAPIRGCTEHKRRTPTGDKFIFHAHPSWQSGRSWHFSWTGTAGTPVRIPGQIITFIWFAEEDISKIQHLSYLSGDKPSLYAMIETVERPLSMVARTYDGVVVGGRKQLTTNDFHERRRNGLSLTASNLCVVPVDTIYEPIAAIPDEGGSPGDFLLVELEGISVTSRNSEVMDDFEFENDQSENGSVSSDTTSENTSTLVCS
jgi:hypothetical protein